jgi:hypothetical protein
MNPATMHIAGTGLRNALVAIFATLCLALSGAAGLAQQEDDAAEADYTVQDTLNTYIPRVQDSYNVFVFGDSLAEGLAAGLKRLTLGNPKFQVLPRGRSGTGLARPDRYDWNGAIATILERQRVDIAVIFVGSNDTVSVRTDNGNFAIGSAPWHDAYAGHVDTLIEQLRANGTAVYWVELPPMARGDYEEAIRQVTAVHSERAYAAQVRFVNIRQHFVDDSGEFTSTGVDLEGEVRRLRARDGVHFLRRGNDKVASFVLDAIERDVKDVEDGGLSAFDEEVGGTATEVRTTAPNVPIFGQESETGASLRVELGPEITLVRREDEGDDSVAGLDVTLRDGSGRQNVVVGGGSDDRFAPRVAPNTLAARVLIEGAAVEARPGRADNFAWPRAD